MDRRIPRGSHKILAVEHVLGLLQGGGFGGGGVDHEADSRDRPSWVLPLGCGPAVEVPVGIGRIPCPVGIARLGCPAKAEPGIRPSTA